VTWIRLIRRLGEVVPLIAAVVAGFFTLVIQSKDFLDQLHVLLNSIISNPVIGIVLGVLLLAFVVLGLSFYIIIKGRITTAASSLGYSASPSPESESRAERSERYSSEDVLSPLLIARLRLIDHIKTLRNNAVTNLFIGIVIAALGVIILFWAVLQIGSMQLAETQNIDTYKVVALIIFPKLSITLFIQIFSYFFLAMYRSNQQEIRYFQNEITMIDSLASALIGAGKNVPAMKIVLAALSKNERNRLMKKGEKSIVASDEAEFIQALSVVSRWKETLDLSEKHS
jgi:hypothetical protein